MTHKILISLTDLSYTEIMNLFHKFYPDGRTYMDGVNINTLIDGNLYVTYYNTHAKCMVVRTQNMPAKGVDDFSDIMNYLAELGVRVGARKKNKIKAHNVSLILVKNG